MQEGAQEFLESIGVTSELATVGAGVIEIEEGDPSKNVVKLILKEIDKIIQIEDNPFHIDAMLMDKVRALMSLDRFEEALGAVQHIKQIGIRARYYADIGIRMKEAKQDAGKIGFLLRQLPFQTDKPDVEATIGKALLEFEHVPS